MKWMRGRLDGRESWGRLEGDEVLVHEGDLAQGLRPTGERWPLERVQALMPCQPRTMLGLWNNFQALAEKNNWARPAEPLYFLKAPGSWTGPLSEGSALRRMRRADLGTYLADGLMPKADVTSMAHGLELRAPLLDHEIVRFGLALPDALHRDAHGGKRLLRAILARYLPGHDFVRPKQGFSVPVSAWFGGGFGDRLSQLADGPLITSGLLGADGIQALLAEHRAGRRDHGERFFALLMLEEWLRAEGREATA